MIWWIVVGLVVGGVVLLAAVVALVMGHLRPFNRAMRGLQLRSEQAQKLQARVTDLQERSVDLQSKVDLVTTRAERLRRR